MSQPIRKAFVPVIEQGFDFESWLVQNEFAALPLENDPLPDRYKDAFSRTKVYSRVESFDVIYVRLLDVRPAHHDIEIFTYPELFDSMEEFCDRYLEEQKMDDRERELINMISCIIPQNSAFAHQLFAHIFGDYKVLARSAKTV